MRSPAGISTPIGAGRPEGETAAGLRRIVGAAVAVALSRADDATLTGVAAYVARAMAVTSSLDTCMAMGLRADLAAAARIAPDPAAAALCGPPRCRIARRRVSRRRRRRCGSRRPRARRRFWPSGAACADIRMAYAAMLSRPETVAGVIRTIVMAEARAAADVLATMGR